MTDRYIFTVASGRCGQSSLSHFLNTHVENCYAAFEEPSPRLHFCGILGDMERRFRRRFVETHELLGRGKVLSAFDSGDEAYLDRIVAKRLVLMDKKGAGIHIDVSKYFARGLHHAFARACPDLSLILLVRDPILNMRSFLNRNKSFTLDNNMPEAKSNLLRLPCDGFEKGELYLWAWCEMYLRYLALIEKYNIEISTVIHTSDLNDAYKMNAHFDTLQLLHTPVKMTKPRNTNVEQGKDQTVITTEDIELFEKFILRVPQPAVAKISYLSDYDPRGQT
jgi:hypothetical protein